MVQPNDRALMLNAAFLILKVFTFFIVPQLPVAGEI